MWALPGRPERDLPGARFPERPSGSRGGRIGTGDLSAPTRATLGIDASRIARWSITPTLLTIWTHRTHQSEPKRKQGSPSWAGS